MATSPKMSSHGLIAYTALFEELRFIKKQQWTATNYLLAIYAGLFGVAHAIGELTKCDKIIGTALTIMALVVAVVIVTLQQFDLKKARVRLNNIEMKYFIGEEREIYEVKKDNQPYSWSAFFSRSYMCFGFWCVGIDLFFVALVVRVESGVFEAFGAGYLLGTF
jgi:hypothetical protein